MIHKLKLVATRSAALLGVAGLLSGIVAASIPAMVFANALNPLTERSLTLSSSSPGWSYTDGSGNATYAPPNSGANGQKAGNTFSFKVSSTASVSGFSFQYCTTAAGSCLGPGDDGYTGTSPTATRNGDSSTTSDLNVATSTPTEISSADWTTISGSASQIPAANDTQGDFVVLVNGAYSSGWTMATENLEDDTVGNAKGATGKQNLIGLYNSTPVALTSAEPIKIIFFATNGNYITNPGSGAFFVKINDYNTSADSSVTDVTTALTDYGPTSTYIIDGGVTVANVMNLSIEIQTKVLETMDFSVGTVDPDTLTDAQYQTASGSGTATHGQCDAILNTFDPSFNDNNVLILGNENAENSLMTSRSFATHSYFRLSSNSSGGATVYYSGVTLSNTENNQIAPIGDTASTPVVGTEQFGLGLDNGTATPYAVDYSTAANGPTSGIQYENGEDTDNGVSGLSTDWATYQSANSASVHDPQLAPLVPESQYGGAGGGLNTTADGNATSAYAFDANANTVPVPIATENSTVVNCVTGKVRYMANIAATTPAGIYTTKINYIAAPQY